jgi:hypothetical protein
VNGGAILEGAQNVSIDISQFSLRHCYQATAQRQPAAVRVEAALWGSLLLLLLSADQPGRFEALTTTYYPIETCVPLGQICGRSSLLKNRIPR